MYKDKWLKAMGQRLPRVCWKECDKTLRKDGWYEVRRAGDHHHYAHPSKPGLVTIPERATLAMPLLKSILKQAKLSNEEFIRLLHKGGTKNG
jgi:predicted RNA binding protein YcfA (HicA-like mRNA interferase family)